MSNKLKVQQAVESRLIDKSFDNIKDVGPVLEFTVSCAVGNALLKLDVPKLGDAVSPKIQRTIMGEAWKNYEQDGLTYVLKFIEVKGETYSKRDREFKFPIVCRLDRLGEGSENLQETEKVAIPTQKEMDDDALDNELKKEVKKAVNAIKKILELTGIDLKL